MLLGRNSLMDNSKANTGCCCGSVCSDKENVYAEKTAAKVLLIEWRHLDVEGEMSARSYDTGENLAAEIKRLNRALNPQGIEVKYIEKKLDKSEIFESNMIFFNNVPLEDIINIEVSQNYCGSCSDLLGKTTYCRTIIFEGNEYEAVPAKAIRKAAYKVLGLDNNTSVNPGCCTSDGDSGCENTNADPSCSCVPNKCDCATPASRKAPKIIISLVVLLAVVSIVTYKMTAKPDIKNSKSFYVAPKNFINSRFFPYGSVAVDFTLGKPSLETTTANGNTIQAEQNLGSYVVSLDELNIIAADSDVVFVFIPGPGNSLIDDTTKNAIFEIHDGLKKSNATIGLYTLWYDSPDYLKIVKQTKIPAIIIARNGKGTITLPGSNINEYMLFQAYLKAATMGCCEYYVPGCC